MQNVYVFSIKKDIFVKEVDDDKNIIITDNLFLFEDFNISDIFVSYEHKTPLEFRLEFFNIPYESLVLIGEKENLKEVLDEDNEVRYYAEDYQIFSGKKIDASKEETKRDILINIKLLSEVMFQMLGAGYLEEKNYKKIEDWIISFEEPILKLFKNYLKVETSNPSVGFEEEFLINPQFRKMILITILKIVSNFIVNSKMITLKKVAQIGQWEDIKLWKKLRKDLKLFK